MAKTKTLVQEQKLDLALVEKYRSEIDTSNTNSVLNFGVKAQKNVGDISRQMLEGVKTKETGAVGELLVGMVTQMRGLDFGQIQPGKEVGFLGRLLGKITPIAKFIQQYETVSSHVMTVRDNLERHQVALRKDIKMLDKLYQETLVYFHDLAAYIEAGKKAIVDLDDLIMDLNVKAATENDVLAAQEVSDKSAFRNMLERKVHDLELTRTVVMQSLPSIRMIQQNDNDLVEKINTQILMGIPAWERQMALAVTMWRSADATKSSKILSDNLNDSLRANAEMLKQSNKEARLEIERGIYDIDAVKAANEDLITTITDSINIAREASAKRVQASAELVECENKLKEVLRNAAA